MGEGSRVEGLGNDGQKTEPRLASCPLPSPSTLDPPPSTTFDTLIVGGGPAGLSAAIYLGRSLHSVAVLDCPEPGRSDWDQCNHNYLGFADGISIRELGERGRKQAERFGASFFEERVTSVIRQADGLFAVRTSSAPLCAKTVILATGVRDRWITFLGSEDFIGRSMHWCLVCDGYEMQGQRVLIVGNDDHAAEAALHLHRFTDQVSLLSEPGEAHLSGGMEESLGERDIRVYRGRIASAQCREPGMCESVETDAGEEIDADHIFSMLGAEPNSELARSLDATLGPEGYITVDTEARTNVPGLYAAGDVTRLFSHQVITAAHEGAAAAMTIAYDLFEEENGSAASRSRG